MQGPGAPIIVRVLEDSESLTWGNVIFNAVGLSGLIGMLAVVLGVLAGGCFIAYRIRQRHTSDGDTGHQRLLG